MNRFEIIEKMFEKLGVYIDGKDMFDIIENDICSNGKMAGNHSIEVGRFGDNRELFFVEVNIVQEFDEEDDVYSTNIEILSVSSDKGVVYPSDIKI